MAYPLPTQLVSTHSPVQTGINMRTAPQQPQQAMNVPQRTGFQSGFGQRGRSGSFTPPVAGNIQQAISTYESMGQPSMAPQAGPAYVYAGGRPQERFLPTPSQITRPADPRGGSGRRISLYPQGGGMAPRTIQPLQAIDVPEAPEFKPDEFAPPEEDPGVYGRARQQAMGPGLRALRRRTREAISTAQSLDNPNARSMFIKSAIEGMGAGLEGVSAAAGREARAVAGQKRREQLDLYRTKYEVKRDADLLNYRAKVNQMAADFAQQQSIAQATYQAQFDPSVQIEGQETGGVGGSFSRFGRPNYLALNRPSQAYQSYVRTM